jgi:hypothetical protein
MMTATFNNKLIAIMNWKAGLLTVLDSPVFEFNRERVFISFLTQTVSERVVNGHRASDDSRLFAVAI